MNIVVTGGSGFIGTYLIDELIKNGHQVKIYDKRISQYYPDLTIMADVRDQAKLTEALQGVDIVYHLAAEHHDDVQPISLYYDVNVKGAEYLIESLERNNVKKLIFTSTVALYGLNAGQPDESSPANPFNDYGKSKYEAEKVFIRWAEKNEDHCLTIVRPTVIFGENNRGNVFNLLKQISSKKFIMVGNGNNRKSLGYVKNIALFMSHLLNADKGIQIYNYADKPDLTTKELVKIVTDALKRQSYLKIKIPFLIGLIGGYAFDMLAKILNRKLPISSIRIRKFCANTVINAEKLKKHGFIPPHTLESGLKRTVQHEFLN